MQTKETSRKPLRVEKVEACGGWWTLEAAAKKLGLTRAAVYETVRREDLRVRAFGKTLLVWLDDLEGARVRAKGRRK